MAGSLFVLAGVNGAGKSSVGGEALRESGADYWNPDEAARALIEDDPALSLLDAQSRAWQIGRELLERAIREGGNRAFETTLGGSTIARLLEHASASISGRPKPASRSGSRTPQRSPTPVKTDCGRSMRVVATLRSSSWQPIACSSASRGTTIESCSGAMSGWSIIASS